MPPSMAATSCEKLAQPLYPGPGPELPAEQLVVEHQGDDFGWPECYFDGYQQKLVLAPEYGGDGKKVGVCAQKQAPIAFLSGALGTERHEDRRRHAIPDGLSRWCLHRLPWLVEPRARAAGRLQRGVPAAG